MPTQHPRTAISLFSSGGIGDLALRGLGIEVLLSNELLEDRHSIYQANNLSVHCISGDINSLKSQIDQKAKELLGGRPLDILFATPPCQGMSKNGRGKLLQGIRSGEKPKLDVRNRLVIPALDLCNSLSPETIVFENVPEMENTVIEEPTGRIVGILEYIRERLGSGYVGRGEVVEFADYGVPQCRQRLITVFTRNSNLTRYFKLRGSMMPPHSHSEDGTHGLPRWRTVRDTIADLPPLDGRDRLRSEGFNPLHTVSALDEDKYYWVSNTPPERSAFDNQCVHCGCRENPTHQARRDSEGINRTSKDTPVRCVECGELLPRPWVKETDGTIRLMKGFTSAYKRMSWDAPSNALTTNFAYACSDAKVHPEQHRALSILEALMLQTITDYDYKWERADGKKVGAQLIRDIIGESIPPRGLHAIFSHLLTVMESSGDLSASIQPRGTAELALW